MTSSDRWIGGLFLLFSLVVIREASKLDFTSNYGAGSGFFPFWLGISGVVLSTVLVFQALRHRPLPAVAASAPSWSAKKALAYCALLVFVFVSDIIGFATAFTVLVAFLLMLEGENWRRSIAVAVASGIGFYLFFVRLLDVKLPLGRLGF
jgi:hypothetical protein